MSWYRDPQLFIYINIHSQFEVYRVTKDFGVLPMLLNDTNKLEGLLSFREHLFLGNNKESDFDAFKATLRPQFEIEKLINSQGWVIYWDIARQRGTWSVEEPNSPFWSLPGITKHKPVTELLTDNQALAEENLELKAKNSNLQDEVNRERDEKSALINGLKREDMLNGLEDLKQQVEDLTSKLVQCCGAGGGSSVEEPWITGQTVHSNWVLFKDLDVLELSKNTTLTITKATGSSKLGDDKTTNVQANFYYRGIYPIVLVDVAELTPNREEARFDPSVWGLYNNSGINYAARKPFASEMSADAHKKF